MPEFVTFWSAILENICDFLMSEPIIYFVGIFLLCMVGSCVNRLIKN